MQIDKPRRSEELYLYLPAAPPALVGARGAPKMQPAPVCLAQSSGAGAVSPPVLIKFLLRGLRKKRCF